MFKAVVVRSEQVDTTKREITDDESFVEQKPTKSEFFLKMPPTTYPPGIVHNLNLPYPG